jgi:hypothetical protein
MIILLPLLTMLAHIFEQDGLQLETLHVIAVMIIMFLAGIALNFINAPANTLMQGHTPSWIKGRVLALQLVIYNGSAIPFILLIGELIHIFTLSTVLYIVAIATAIFGFWGLYYERKQKIQAYDGFYPSTKSIMDRTLVDRSEETPCMQITSSTMSENNELQER